jgi:glycosyltransferase involved in cell wall biosynthesis
MSRLPVSTTICSNRPALVSVAMTTYNQEQFIEQSIQSVLSQVTDFPFELVIGDDRSTDRTRSVVIRYARRHPGQVRVLLHPKNRGPQRNLVQTLRACRGRHIALLEADDYWTSVQKLQKQVTFLEAHPQCAQCFHAVTAFFEDARAAPFIKGSPPGLGAISTLEDLLKFNYMPYCSVMFRGESLDSFPSWYYTQTAVDWLLFILIAQTGLIGYLDESMAAYRIHADGVWSRLSPFEQQRALLESYDVLKTHFGGRFDGSIRCGQFHCHYKLAMAHLDCGDGPSARAHALKGVMQRPFGNRYDAELVVRVLLRSYLPPAFGAARWIYRILRNLRKTLRAQ